MAPIDAIRAALGSWKRFRSYEEQCAGYRLCHAATPAGFRKSGVAVNFPQAEDDFVPPLFMPTHRPERNLYEQLFLKAAYLCLYATTRRLGYHVNQCNNQDADRVFYWSEKRSYRTAPEKRVYMELGWLPRWTCQISPDGTNTRSHVSTGYRQEALGEGERAAVVRCLARLRLLFSANLAPARVQAVRERAAEPFILFAFQLAGDFNLKYSGSRFQQFHSKEPGANAAFAQACVDYAESVDLPCRVVFKQHPGDRSDLRAALRFQKPSSVLWTNADDFSAHEIFASGLCRLVVTVNSNTLHEASAWDIPGVCLGNLVWTDSASPRPFPAALENCGALIGKSIASDDVRLNYIRHILRHQWTLNDFQNPLIVERLVQTCGRCEPHALRREFGLEL